MRQENDLGKDPIGRLVVRIALPSMLAQLVNVLYNIVDRMYIGNIAQTGDLALAGVGVCGPIVTLISSFAFLVGIPTMFAASGYAFFELARHGQLAHEAWSDVGIAFAAAVVTGFVVVKWLLGYIKHHRFTGFAVYRMALGAALLLFLPAGH